MNHRTHLSGNEKKGKRENVLKISNENLDQSNESLHNDVNEYDEINDPNEPNDAPNIFNIENLGPNKEQTIPPNNGIDEEQKILSLNIYDSINWTNLDNKTSDILVEKRSILREMNFDFPLDNNNMHFSYAYFLGMRDSNNMKTMLTNMNTWNEMRVRLDKNETIDKSLQEHIMKEKERWRQVLLRIFSAVKCFATHNLAFRESNEKLYQDSNGNFLGLIEMIAELDVIMQDHVFLGTILTRISRNKQLCKSGIGYFWCFQRLHQIQNELISFLVDNVKSSIIKTIKEEKYFSIILDYTSDINHQEQITLIVRCVNMSTNKIKIEEYFLEFLKSQIKSVKAIRFQTLQIRLALLELYESCDYAKSKSEVESLINALRSFEFLLGMIICNKLQSKSICIDTTIKKLEGILSYFEKYRDEGFTSSMNIVKSIALNMDVEPTLPTKRYSIFEQLKTFESIVGFLFDSNKLKSLDEKEPIERYATFHSTFSYGDSSDIDLNDLFFELKVLQFTLPNELVSATKILKFVKSIDCYLNLLIAYRIFLTVLVIVASSEKKKFKAKVNQNLLEVVNVTRTIEWSDNFINRERFLGKH
ncbi:hypothetical protein ES332_A05G434900v1 [Gossypium tomentosum]|uniref:Uncharacterized protein n=1 Tax=Gossypium tomentosum TaxID=34277 RepID=A0A5D2QRE2_GOSTO|nr:hypothetical protein ES332_A05G434900v1 [Gossypium tomentosum]